MFTGRAPVLPTHKCGQALLQSLRRAGFPDQALAWLAVFSELSFAGGEGSHTAKAQFQGLPGWERVARL